MPHEVMFWHGTDEKLSINEEYVFSLSAHINFYSDAWDSNEKNLLRFVVMNMVTEKNVNAKKPCHSQYKENDAGMLEINKGKRGCRKNMS